MSTSQAAQKRAESAVASYTRVVREEVNAPKPEEESIDEELQSAVFD
jgi:hypothetical protein